MTGPTREELDQAMAATKAFVAAGGDEFSPRSPISLLMARHKLQALSERFSAGDGYALMLALRECARCSLPMPDWLAVAYIARFDRVHNFRAASWDEVFDSPKPKGKSLAALRKRRQLAPAIVGAVDAAIEAGASVDQALFERIGAEHNVSGSTARDLYYETRDVFAPWHTSKNSR